MTHSGSFLAPCVADEVFAMLSDPQRFAPTLPDFESMQMQDATHFKLRVVIALGQIRGHANLAMELCEAVRPSQVHYRGEAVVAGGQLGMAIRFSLEADGVGTSVQWEGEVQLDAMLTFLTGNLLETAGRDNFERMAERLQDEFRTLPPAGTAHGPTAATAAEIDYEI